MSDELELLECWIGRVEDGNFRLSAIEMLMLSLKFLRATFQVLPGEHNELYDDHVYKCESNYIDGICNCGMDNLRKIIKEELL